jgi:putative methionine-R-sulfoxide reductase with GAF domain/anti-sigma regulatory factor (Ser/Thr protein kinase)
MLAHNTVLNLIIVIPLRIWIEFMILGVLLLLGLFLLIRLREKKIREIEATKTELEKVRSEYYKERLEREQINNFFSNSLMLKNDVDEILWDGTKNLIAKLGFEDCLIYMWNDKHTKMVQRAGFGVKDSKEILIQFPYDLAPGEGIVGSVAASGNPIIVPDTREDPRYLAEGYSGLSEIAVPIKYEEELLGVIDSEHSQLGFFNHNHLQILTTIGTLMASKIKAIEADQQLRKQKMEIDNISKQLIEMQLSALRSQMNPHFIFNALNSIKKFVLSNDVENADIYLGKFSRLMRSILNNTREPNISLDKEIEMLTLYLELEKLRFGKKLEYRIEVDPSLQQETTFIPTMIVQPFIENAMLHGIMHKECCGKIHISFNDHEDYIEIKVKDNGVGRKAATELKANKKEAHTSLGIEVISARLMALNKNGNVPSVVEITDLEEDGKAAGTLVKICVPQ